MTDPNNPSGNSGANVNNPNSFSGALNGARQELQESAQTLRDSPASNSGFLPAQFLPQIADMLDSIGTMVGSFQGYDGPRAEDFRDNNANANRGTAAMDVDDRDEPQNQQQSANQSGLDDRGYDGFGRHWNIGVGGSTVFGGNRDGETYEGRRDERRRSRDERRADRRARRESRRGQLVDAGILDANDNGPHDIFIGSNDDGSTFAVVDGVRHELVDVDVSRTRPRGDGDRADVDVDMAANEPRPPSDSAL